ncbi:MAG: zinc-dependent alcohol dehydrogenase family protein [Pseudomonadota bacterium]
MAATRIYRFHEYGGPDKLKLESAPLPDPGPGEVRVRVQAMSLNRADLLWLANTYVETPKLPARLGYEVAGVVEAVGPGVTAHKPGDRVSSLPAFSISDYGNFGETAIIPERGLMQTPNRLSPAEGASFAFAYFTGYFALYELARLQPFQTVLATAATSTTGLAAIPLIHKAGATVIATTRTSKKKDALLKAGADHVVATDEEDLTARVMAITGGEGVDAAYDCVAGSLSDRIARSVRAGGRWIVYGLLDTPGGFPWLPAIVRCLQINTYQVFQFTGNRNLKLTGDEGAFARSKRFIAAGLADGSLPPVPIDREFQGVESLPEAMTYMASNAAAGKIVVLV